MTYPISVEAGTYAPLDFRRTEEYGFDNCALGHSMLERSRELVHGRSSASAAGIILPASADAANGTHQAILWTVGPWHNVIEICDNSVAGMCRGIRRVVDTLHYDSTTGHACQ